MRSLPSHAQSIDGFEVIYCELHHTQPSLPVLSVYRSPSASAPADIHLFQSIQYVSNQQNDCVILGDFNVPQIDWTVNLPISEGSYEFALVDAIDGNMLIQHVRTPTRFRSEQEPSLLDLVLTKYPDSITELQ